ncbi:hypothetical protein [Streptomyces triticisoli]|uniref:hypothetical protein n=1 Tax=Streptomyces triticisoli TaxID=2182797 RepID=UPI000DD9C8A3|nr:hypothetical protein [Streptomyces triticisoli]
MHTRTTAMAVAVLALVLSACSSKPDQPDATPTATATATPTIDQAAARQACVDAWADVLQADPDAGLEDEPVPCDGLPKGDRIDRYMEGLQQRNKANRDRVAACVEDPACTSVPIP